jgi:hypothetical protein
MGDRTTIQFKNGDELSPCLYGHNSGLGILYEADEFMEILKTEYALEERVSDPITRREPSAILVMFINRYVKQPEDGGYRLTDSTNHYRNNDNGHWIVDLEKMKRYRRKS